MDAEEWSAMDQQPHLRGGGGGGKAVVALLTSYT